MEPSDLTVRILQEIRDEVRGVGSRLDDQTRGLGARFDDLNERFDKQTRLFMERFEVIETSLRDLAQQLVILARGVRQTLDSRSAAEDRVDALERT